MLDNKYENDFIELPPDELPKNNVLPTNEELPFIEEDNVSQDTEVLDLNTIKELP